MLLSFGFGNHRSFADDQQLNLTRVYRSDSPARSEDTSLPVAAIFGGNASGKSNALGALAYLRRLVRSSDRVSEPGGGIETDPFRLNPANPVSPSSFVVDLNLHGVRYTYGLRVDRSRVVEEWLYSYPLRHRRKIFERRGNDYSYGEEARGTSIAQVEGVTAENVLFLSTTARFNQELVQPVYRWFLNRLIVAPSGEASALRYRSNPPLEGLSRNEDRLRTMAELLRAADTGIEDVLVKTEDPGPPDEAVVEQYRRTFAADPELAEVRIRRLSAPRSRLVFAHRGSSGPVDFDIDDESSGTIRLLHIADLALAAISRGTTLLVDEIDASLHPLLTAKLIGLFQNPETNPRRGQLIFTSHDATLLGTLDGIEVLRRDEIWFTSKDHATGASTLYPLSDYKPRKGESRERRYLAGSYDAIPDGSWELFEAALRARQEDTDGSEEDA